MSRAVYVGLLHLNRKFAMSTEVLVSYELTMEEMRSASLIWKREYGFSGQAWYGTIFSKVMTLVYCVMVFIALRQSWLAQSFDGVLIYLVLGPLILKMLSHRWASRHPDLNHPIRYTILSERWLIESHTMRNEFLWPPVKSIVRVSEGFVVDFRDRAFRWLPIKGFESDVAVETFVGMVKSHDVKYDDRRQA